MKKTLIAGLLGATLLGGGAVAYAQNATQDAPRERMMHDPMMMADANKDGVVTRDETIAAVTARFARLDANKDGRITADERQAARAAMAGRMAKRMRKPDGAGGPGMKRGPDANGDGMLSLDEQRARALKHFDFIDRNGDGRIDQAERQLVHEVMREMMRGMRGGRGGGHNGPHGPHHGGDMPPPPPGN